jgi:phage shock protein E
MLKIVMVLALLGGPEHTQEPIDQVKASVQTGKSTLVDVREKDEWDAGHLKDARLVTLSALKADGAAASKPLPKGKPVYTHCRSGKRSVTAAKILKDLGFDARALEQGYAKLLEAGFPKAP